MLPAIDLTLYFEFMIDRLFSFDSVVNWMKLILIRICSIIAFLLGIFSVLSGSSVLLGINEPHYSPYLLIVYYTLMGFIEISISIFVWKIHAIGLRASICIALTHGIVTFLLAFVFEDIAVQNIAGIGIRAGFWSLITLVFFIFRSKSY